MEIASAAIGVAGDVATDLVDAGTDLLEDSDDMVEAMTEDLPGGGVVNLMWDVVLLPGRVGLKVVTTVLKRTEPEYMKSGPDASNQAPAPFRHPGGRVGPGVTSDTHSRRSRSVKKPSERTVSVPACLREARFAAVCCSTETDHLQADSASCSLLWSVRLDF